jgi:hypothetical protein
MLYGLRHADTRPACIIIAGFLSGIDDGGPVNPYPSRFGVMGGVLHPWRLGSSDNGAAVCLCRIFGGVHFHGM